MQPFLTIGYKKPKSSNQSKIILRPTDFIAQLIERENLDQKVEGSIPVAAVAFVHYSPYQARKR